MTTKNDVTGDSLITKAPTDAYRANYDSIFKKPKKEAALQELAELSQDLGLYEDKSKERCFECHSPEWRHKLDCSSKAVFDAYITLRDSIKWGYFTEVMLTELDNKVLLEMTERKFKKMFDEEEENATHNL